MQKHAAWQISCLQWKLQYSNCLYISWLCKVAIASEQHTMKTMCPKSCKVFCLDGYTTYSSWMKCTRQLAILSLLIQKTRSVVQPVIQQSDIVTMHQSTKIDYINRSTKSSRPYLLFCICSIATSHTKLTGAMAEKVMLYWPGAPCSCSFEKLALLGNEIVTA